MEKPNKRETANTQWLGPSRYLSVDTYSLLYETIMQPSSRYAVALFLIRILISATTAFSSN